MALDQYYLLGKSGLRVSRLALGAMNFGTDGFHAAYGRTEDEVRPILRAYLDAGGNFVDTADFYTAGQSETILGVLLAEADRTPCSTRPCRHSSSGGTSATSPPGTHRHSD